MEKYALLKQLMLQLEDFERSTPEHEIGLHNFAYWLLSQAPAPEASKAHEQFDPSRQVRVDHSPEVEISGLIAGLYKYAKSYSKRAMEGSPINSLDEFGFLASLLRHESLTKTELVAENQVEFTSGNDIIRRLLKEELVDEFPDPIDRRSKRIRISPKGRMQLFALFGHMNQAAHIVSGPLSPTEKLQLLHLLRRLRLFHHGIRAKDRHTSLPELLHRYLHHPLPEGE